MNKVIILLTIILTSLNISTVRSQPEKESPNTVYISPVGFSVDDSLLYDGHYGKFKPADHSSDCKIKVTYSFGTVEGTKLVTKIYDICGDIDTGMSAKKSEIHTGDFIKYGEELTTGDNSRVDIELWDGSEVKLGPNSSVVIEDYMCEGNVLVQMKNGTMWNKVKKLLGGNKYEVKTGTMGGVRGTEFTIEYNNGEEIIKVYEGTFEVYAPKTKNDNKSTAQEMEQLTKDFQAGKITKEEFNRKLTEFMQNTNKKIEESTNKMVTAGNMVKVTTDKITELTPFDVNENRWFDDVNFKK